MKARLRLWGVVRRICQLSVVSFIAYAGISLHWRNFKVAHNQARLVGLMKGPGWEKAYALNERLLEALSDDPLTLSDSMLGMPWATTLLGLPLADPMAVAGLLFQGQLPPAAMLLAALVPIGIALFAGRLFCSFLCPARLAFEAGNAVRSGLQRLGLDLAALTIPRIGLWVGLGLLGASTFAGMGVLTLGLPYWSLGAGVATLTMTGSAGVALWVFGAMLAVDLLIAPGQICRSVCPTGAWLEQVGRLAPLRLEKVEPTACGPCDICQRVCPYGLFPGQESHHPSCDTCGRCTLACPDQKLAPTLRLGWKR